MSVPALNSQTEKPDVVPVDGKAATCVESSKLITDGTPPSAVNGKPSTPVVDGISTAAAAVDVKVAPTDKPHASSESLSPSTVVEETTVLKLKTLQSNQSWTVSIVPSDTIGSLKKKLDELVAGPGPAEALRIIFAGKILDDTKSVVEVGFTNRPPPSLVFLVINEECVRKVMEARAFAALEADKLEKESKKRAIELASQKEAEEQRRVAHAKQSEQALVAIGATKTLDELERVLVRLLDSVKSVRKPSEKKANSSDSWACGSCTTLNRLALTRCSVCSTRMPNAQLVGKKAATHAVGAAAAASVPTTAVGDDDAPWTCSTCTYQNRAGELCAMCYTPASASKPNANDDDGSEDDENDDPKKEVAQAEAPPADQAKPEIKPDANAAAAAGDAGAIAAAVAV